MNDHVVITIIVLCPLWRRLWPTVACVPILVKESVKKERTSRSFVFDGRYNMFICCTPYLCQLNVLVSTLLYVEQ